MHVDPTPRMAKVRKRTDSAFDTDTPVSVAETPDTPPAEQAHDDLSQEDPRDRIAMRAYELYLARGGSDGGDFDDWLAAEREISRSSGTASRGDAGE